MSVEAGRIIGIEIREPRKHLNCDGCRHEHRDVVFVEFGGRVVAYGKGCVPQHLEAQSREIIQAADAIFKNSQTMATPALVTLAKREILTDEQVVNYGRLVGTSQRRVESIRGTRTDLNKLLLKGMIFSPERLYYSLCADRAEGTGPKLIKLARTRGIIQEHEEKFYLNTWKKPFDSLTEPQQRWRSDINERIIAHLRELA